MTTTSRKFFHSIQDAHRHLKAAGFTLVDISHPFGWAHFARKRAAGLRWGLNAAGVEGYYITFVAI